MPYLNNLEIFDLIKKKAIFSNNKIHSKQLQPASLDLTLSSKCYRVKSSFLPNSLEINKIIKELSLIEIGLDKDTILEKNCIYLCELNEHLNLPSDIMGKSNPKSTTGRLDIFTRIITDFGTEYDFIKNGYNGKLYLEIIPQSFSIIIKKGISLNQVRFIKGIENENFLFNQKLSVEIKKNKISAYKAKKIT